MSVATALELAMQREELAAHVAVLITPEKVERGDGAGQAEVLPLLTCVQHEQDSKRGAGGRSTTLASTRAPVRLSATELLVRIDRVTGNHGGRRRIEAVRAWSARAGSSPELGVVSDAAETARRWVLDARHAIAPTRRFIGLRGASCPDCGHAQVVAPGTAGEDVLEPALAADTSTGVVSCLVDGCGAMWPVDQLELLADVLRTQTSSETLNLD